MFPFASFTKLLVSVLYNLTFIPDSDFSLSPFCPFPSSSTHAVPVIIAVPFAISLLSILLFPLFPLLLSLVFASMICVISDVVATLFANNSAYAVFVIVSASVLDSE